MGNFGGNHVEQLSPTNTTSVSFATGKYHYGLYVANANSTFVHPPLASCTLFLLSCPTSVTVTLQGTETPIREGDAIQVEGTTVRLTIGSGGDVRFLIAGVSTSTSKPSVVVTQAHNIKKVVKPWGHELWINGEHPGFAFKQIYIKAPHKTSLQFHNFKEETNVLFEGRARLHFKNNPAVENNKVTPQDTGTVDLEPLSVIGVRPPVLHRIEALTDLLLYETSTPHLDDVVRIADDAQRPDGRIPSEHRAQ